ncbi:MAG: hypothetical protein ACOC4J_06040 [Bacteroidota bacterium]
MKQVFIIILFYSIFSNNIHSQDNYIGLGRSDIIKKMKNEKPDFIQQKVINKSYNYLKYMDTMGERTILIFFSDDNRCTQVKLMSHYVHLGSTIDSLNKEYEKIDKHQWKYTVDNEDILVKLDKGEWFFTIITKKME